jgi:N-acylglucosamine 2-epimerase
MNSYSVEQYRDLFKNTLLNDVLPFWLNHGVDSEWGGIITSLDRDGRRLDTDKSIWFQGRTAWTYATAAKTYGPQPGWLELADSALNFIEKYAVSPNGKLYFTVTRDGRPLRMRRYVYSEAFAAQGNAAMYRVTGSSPYLDRAVRYVSQYLHFSFTPGLIAPKVDPNTRPMISLGPYMFAVLLCGEMLEVAGDAVLAGRSCSEWIQSSIESIERFFYKPELSVLMETVGEQGEVLDHFDGRTLNPGHAIECAWFLMHQGEKSARPEWIELGCQILDRMWQRGWDQEHGGLFYFRDLHNGPVQEYWHDMKFWWPHCEAIIANLLAFRLTSRECFLKRFHEVNAWSFQYFSDNEHGEWYGYLHRDGTPSVRLKGNMWKGPYHLPRMLWYCEQLLAKMLAENISFFSNGHV